jgi:hypothetical protein
MLVAAFFGVLLPLINRKYEESKYTVIIPSASSLGLAFIIAPSQSMTLFFGTVLTSLWQMKDKKACDSLSFQFVASFKAKISFSRLYDCCCVGAGMIY